MLLLEADLGHAGAPPGCSGGKDNPVRVPNDSCANAVAAWLALA
jgi:hypothetical protein